MNILLLTSSPRTSVSLSTRFATELATGLHITYPNATLTVRNLADTPLPHLSDDYITGRSLAAEQRSPAQTAAVQLSDQLIDELLKADIVVIGSGMINFGPPTLLKSWFDYVIWPGISVKYTAEGPIGLVQGKKAYLVSASGGVFSEGEMTRIDFQTPYIKHLLNFIGVTDVRELRIEGTAFGPEAAQAVIEKTINTVKTVLQEAA